MSKPYPIPKKIDDVKRFILRPALTNHFSCDFPIPVGLIDWAKEGYTGIELDYLNIDVYEKISIMCSEASLPGASLMTHEINNDYTGVTERHAYRRSFDDRADFTFYVDEDYEIIKYFQLWISYITNERKINRALDTSLASSVEDFTFNARMRFPKNYVTNQLTITKFEKNAELDNNPDSYIYISETQKQYLQYNFINAFPISINSIPVSYDQPSLLKCTVSFTYSRFWMQTVESSKTSL